MVEKGKPRGTNKKTRVSKFRKQRTAKLPPAVEMKIHRSEDSSSVKHADILTGSQNDKKDVKNSKPIQQKQAPKPKNAQKNQAPKSKKR